MQVREYAVGLGGRKGEGEKWCNYTLIEKKTNSNINKLI